MHWIMDLRCSYSMRSWYWNYIHTCTQIQDLRYIYICIYILSPLHAVFTILCHPQPATILKFLEASGGRGRSILRPGPRLCQNGCEFVGQFSPSWMEHVRALAFRLERCEAKMEPLLEYGSFMLNPWSFTFPMFVAVVHCQGLDVVSFAHIRTRTIMIEVWTWGIHDDPCHVQIFPQKEAALQFTDFGLCLSCFLSFFSRGWGPCSLGATCACQCLKPLPSRTGTKPLYKNKLDNKATRFKFHVGFSSSLASFLGSPYNSWLSQMASM